MHAALPDVAPHKAFAMSGERDNRRRRGSDRGGERDRRGGDWEEWDGRGDRLDREGPVFKPVRSRRDGSSTRCVGGSIYVTDLAARM